MTCHWMKQKHFLPNTFPRLFVTPTSRHNKSKHHHLHTLIQLTLTVPPLHNHQCGDSAVSAKPSISNVFSNPTCYYPRDFPIFQIWWPGQCLVIVQDSWSPVSSFALYLSPGWRVERVRGGSQRCWAGGGIPAIVSPERGGSGVVFKPGSMNPHQLFDEIKLTEARNSSVPPFFWLILKFISILHAIHVAWNRTHPSCFPAFYNCSSSRNILQIFGELRSLCKNR